MFILLFLAILFLLLGIYLKARYRSMTLMAFVRGESLKVTREKGSPIQTVVGYLPGKMLFEWTTKQLQQARLRQYLPENIMTMSFILSIIFGFIGWLFGWVMTGEISVLLFFIVLFSLGGAFLPYIYIRSEAKKANLIRKKEVLPLVQQLKVLSRSGVGTSFNALAGIVVEDATGVLMKDIQEAVEDISRGKGRKEALLEMAEKTGSSVVKEVMELILDAEEKELPLYDVLESIETRLLLDIETRADEIKSKDEDALALPLAGLILPANMILMVAPGIIGIKSMMTF